MGDQSGGRRQPHPGQSYPDGVHVALTQAVERDLLHSKARISLERVDCTCDDFIKHTAQLLVDLLNDELWDAGATAGGLAAWSLPPAMKFVSKIVHSAH